MTSQEKLSLLQSKKASGQKLTRAESCQLGGLIVATRNDMSELGRKGGRALVAKVGREGMSERGKEGFRVFANKYFEGNRQAAVEWLQSRAMFLEAMYYSPYDNGAFEDPGALEDQASRIREGVAA